MPTSLSPCHQSQLDWFSMLPHPSVLPPAWQSEQHPSIALGAEHTRHSPDGTQLTPHILRQQYSYFITTDFLELYTDRFPQDMALCLSYKSLRFTPEKGASRCLWDLRSDRQHHPPSPSVSFIFVQIPDTLTGGTDPLLLQNFRTACSPQVTQTCNGKQIP